ncbi:phage tail sheath family protein [Xenorhabdus ishibashii]|uniref:Phage tail sheath protein n=1 Tax=Xenorhabdus ishibashii TaxID=1034471 RepID=A0A2D0KAI0_9GAMM|nr:phage tail sheath C-terminal domain-containing protein [Xenorhabdus ishibashii]PHM60360.1 phage tail sheath protein [Xenorhabdus ishibashii]
MLTNTYPGVQIKEVNETSLSVRTSATAVPVFAVNDKNTYLTEKYHRINNWLEYLALKGQNGLFDPSDPLDISLRAYFINGGGYAYLIKTLDLVTQVPKLDDVTLLVAAGEDIANAAGSLCIEGKGLFAIHDGPKKEITNTDKLADILKPYAQSQYAAVYYPWLTAKWGKNKSTINIPPSAVMAGVYASVDNSRGVWKAPANVAIQGGLQPQYSVTDDLQGIYNQGKALNMIRTFTNNGTLVWGARTLDDTDNWRYISVRRLFNSVERDIQNAMKAAVFETNSQPTWEQVRSSIDNYLHNLWQQGALVGTKPKEAYFVQIGQGITMSDDDIKQGKMIAKIGLAAVRPAEFIILQFTQDI